MIHPRCFQKTKGKIMIDIIKIDNDMVFVSRLVKKNRDEKVATNVKWELDFSNLSREQELRLMTTTIVNQIQKRWRAGTVENDQKFNISEFLTASRIRQVKTPEEITIVASTLTEKQLKQLLDNLTDMLDKK